MKTPPWGRCPQVLREVSAEVGVNGGAATSPVASTSGQATVAITADAVFSTREVVAVLLGTRPGPRSLAYRDSPREGEDALAVVPLGYDLGKLVGW